MDDKERCKLIVQKIFKIVTNMNENEKLKTQIRENLSVEEYDHYRLAIEGSIIKEAIEELEDRKIIFFEELPNQIKPSFLNPITEKELTRLWKATAHDLISLFRYCEKKI